MNKLAILIILAALSLPGAIHAQEATEAPLPTQGDSLITVESGGQLVIGQTDPAPVAEPDGIDNGVILIVGVLIVGIGILFVQVRSGKNPDVAASERLESMQMNRDFMAATERAYEKSAAIQKQAIDTLAGVVTAIAPLTTSIKFDDALARLLKDIMTPGPETPPAA